MQEGIYSKVIKKLRDRIQTLRVGNPLDKNTDIGAINSKMQLDKIESYLRIGCEEGAELIVGGAGAVHANGSRTLDSNGHTGNGSWQGATSGFAKGYFCMPCVFRGVQPSHTIAREEIFGPVLAVQSFRTPEEAITRANNTPYGLAAGVWTDKGSKIFDIARQLKAGVVWLNTYNKFDPASPVGGFKESGFGREGGVHGLRGYLDV